MISADRTDSARPPTRLFSPAELSERSESTRTLTLTRSFWVEEWREDTRETSEDSPGSSEESEAVMEETS